MYKMILEGVIWPDSKKFYFILMNKYVNGGIKLFNQNDDS